MAAPYAHEKLTDIEDPAAGFGIGEIQEARFAKNDLETEDTGFSHCPLSGCAGTVTAS